MTIQIKTMVSTYTHQSQFECITFHTLREDLYKLLNNKIIVGIYDPKLYLITHGSISGEIEIVDRVITNRFRTVNALNIERGRSFTRYIPLTFTNNFGYIPNVDEKVSLGLADIRLEAHERDFYKNFVITEFEPTLDNILKSI